MVQLATNGASSFLPRDMSSLLSCEEWRGCLLDKRDKNLLRNYFSLAASVSLSCRDDQDESQLPLETKISLFNASSLLITKSQ